MSGGRSSSREVPGAAFPTLREVQLASRAFKRGKSSMSFIIQDS